MSFKNNYKSRVTRISGLFKFSGSTLVEWHYGHPLVKMMRVVLNMFIIICQKLAKKCKPYQSFIN